MNDVKNSNDKDSLTKTVHHEVMKPKRKRGRPRKTEQQQNNLKQSPRLNSKTVRPSRTRKSRPKEVFQPKHVSWKVKEKKLLIQALKEHSASDIDAIQRVVKSKTKEEVHLYIDKLKKGAIRKIKARGGPKAPIEYWLNLLNDLTNQEKRDYTVNLGKVVSIIANFEEFPKPGPTTPDYKAIYKYLWGMLSEGELPELGSLESAVILDLLHGLVDFLRSHDTGVQREIMLWKYGLLGGKVDMSDPICALAKARKAVENDFSDLYPKDKTQQSTSTNTASSSSSAQTAKKTSSAQTAKKTSSAQTAKETSRAQTAKETSGAQTGKKPHSSSKRTVASKTPCPRKPTLFTMNPLCIPADVIKMNPIIQVSQEELNRLVCPKLPNTQKKVADCCTTVIYEVKEKELSPHPKLPIRRQLLLPSQEKSTPPVPQTSEVFICGPHPEKMIVNPASTKRKAKTKPKLKGKRKPEDRYTSRL